MTGMSGAGIAALNYGQTGSANSITVTSSGFVQGRTAGVFAYDGVSASINYASSSLLAEHRG